MVGYNRAWLSIFEKKRLSLTHLRKEGFYKKAENSFFRSIVRDNDKSSPLSYWRKVPRFRKGSVDTNRYQSAIKK